MSKQVSAVLDNGTRDTLMSVTTFAEALGAIVVGMELYGTEADERIAAKIDAIVQADKKEFGR